MYIYVSEHPEYLNFQAIIPRGVGYECLIHFCAVQAISHTFGGVGHSGSRPLIWLLVMAVHEGSDPLWLTMPVPRTQWRHFKEKSKWTIRVPHTLISYRGP